MLCSPLFRRTVARARALIRFGEHFGMDGPRLTEERLRYHLDSNQVMRERMCLALLPLLGPYTREQPRRPKGGPDGGRDIEALYQGQILIWGAVGFKNGGGLDDSSRDEI